MAVARLLSLMPERQGGAQPCPVPLSTCPSEADVGGGPNAAEGRGPPLGSALVLVDDAAEDIAAPDRATMTRT